MTMLPLIEAALAPLSTGTQELAKNGGLAVGVTLDRPIADFESWRPLILVGTDSEWNPRLALERLEVRQVPFERATPTLHGYASGETLAIAPNSYSPLRTLMHELGHIVLGHTFQHTVRGREKPLREVQAETVAFCTQALIGGLTRESMAVSRGYIDGYRQKLTAPLTGGDIIDISLAVETILSAGR